MIWRFLPLVGTLLVIGIAGCWRPWLQMRRHGTWGVVMFRPGNRGQLIRDSMAIVLLALLLVQAAAIAVQGEPLAAFGRGYLAAPGLAAQLAGSALLFGGLALLVTAQLDLGASWRIGIDENARPGLVTSGLYRFSRNPIFLALLIALAGYVMLVPTPLSLALLAGAYLGIRQQIVEEEKYLLQTYGEAYRDYARRVGRFLSIGKLQ